VGKADDQRKAMRFEWPEHIPVEVSILPATWRRHGAALVELARRYPAIFGPETYIPDDPASAGQDDPYYRKGTFADEWGCVWENIKDGLIGMVKVHPVPTRQDVHALRPPEKAAPGFPHGFMFLRLADLRGFEEVMIDFAEEAPELKMLIDVVLEHNLRKLEATLPHQPPASLMVFGDDLGTQKALPISPRLWRKYLKPCYQAIYGRCHQAGHDVFMHTDGCIHEIIPDLIDCGVNMLNPQVRANGLENLARACKGKVCVSLDLDRQLFPFADARQIRNHIHECVEALYLPEGGLWLQAECEPDVPLETIDAICRTLMEVRDYRQAE
jgi:hypothetical protein